jgi:SNF2 family DNA or RNA helicase
MPTLIPHPYQQILIDAMVAHGRVQIEAGMGMGKTSATLKSISILFEFVCDGPALVLAPLRVAQSVWPQEVEKWDDLRHLKVIPVLGTAAQRQVAVNRRADIYTVNYENLPWLVEYWGKDWPYKIVVADESTRLKSFRLGGAQGKRARTLKKLAHTKIERFYNLTGTPCPNGLIDLWGQHWFLDEGRALGHTFTAFEGRWFRPEHMGGGAFTRIVPCDHAQKEITERVAPHTVCVRAEDWFPDLLAPIEKTVEVELPELAREMYNDMEQRLFLEIAGHEVEAFNAASKTMKCLQLASGAIYVDDTGNWKPVHDAKIEALKSVIEEAAGMPVLVAYHFKSDIQRLRKAFPRGRELDKRPSTVRDWNQGKIPVLFAHPGSAGHGLNLQDGGNIIVFFSHWWDMEQRMQIIERIGPVRQLQAGHNRKVYI